MAEGQVNYNTIVVLDLYVENHYWISFLQTHISKIMLHFQKPSILQKI
jgi:hypothetical protein